MSQPPEVAASATTSSPPTTASRIPGGLAGSDSSKSIHRGFSPKLKKQLIKDLVLPLRIPALMLLAYSLYNTHLYNESNKAFDRGARFGTTRGRLIEIQKNNYFYNAVPRYSVHYEFTVDGKTYESRRATTGSFYRDWMSWLYTDTITESQYLQAFPVLRQGEPCTVYYDKRNPARHSAVAADSNSGEAGVALYLAVFPLVFANMLQASFLAAVRRWRPPRYRVKMPGYDREQAVAAGAGTSK